MTYLESPGLVVNIVIDDPGAGIASQDDQRTKGQRIAGVVLNGLGHDPGVEDDLLPISEPGEGRSQNTTDVVRDEAFSPVVVQCGVCVGHVELVVDGVDVSL